MSHITEKSEILFLYESKYSTPNGDPFTGEQRYDDESKRILVSDVRIKRFIRDYLIEFGKEIFVINDKSQIVSETESGAASRLNSLINKYKDDPDVKIAQKAIEIESVEANTESATEQAGGKSKKAKKPKNDSGLDVVKLLQKCIDVRLFGGISTKEGMAVNLTGPVQFALLNPSLNRSDLRIHQNTSVFSSSAEKERGAIGTTSVVPYGLMQIHGWVNPFSARHSGLTSADLEEMFAALWHSINNANTRSKSGQSAVLLVQIVYREATDKLYESDKLIKLNPSEKQEEQIRDSSDFKLGFEALKNATKSPKVLKIRFFTENEDIEREFLKEPKVEGKAAVYLEKFEKMTLVLLTQKQAAS